MNLLPPKKEKQKELIQSTDQSGKQTIEILYSGLLAQREVMQTFKSRMSDILSRK
jgi:hypothetical protein